MDANKTGRRIPLSVIMLGIVSFFTDSATEMIYPLIPVYVAMLGSGAITLGIIEGLAETTAAILKLVSGVISDKIGKYKFLVLLGYGLSSLIRPLTGLVSGAWQIVVIRMIDRVGKGIRTAPRDAMIAAVSDPRIHGKVYGFHRAMDNTGAVVGPLMAISMLLLLFLGFEFTDALLALRWTFVLAIIPGLLAILTIIFFVKEPPRKEKSGEPFRFSLQNFDRNFKRYLMILVIFTLGNSSDAFLLFRVEEAIHQSGAVYRFAHAITPVGRMLDHFGNSTLQMQIVNILFLPVVWAYFNIIKVVLSTPLGALSDRIGRKTVINVGWGIYAAVYLAFALIIFLPAPGQIAATFLLFGIYALFYAFTEGAEKAFVADMVPEGQRGSAFGLYNFAIGLGALPASVIFGILYSTVDAKYPGYGGTVAFGFGSLLATISILLLKFTVQEPNKGNSFPCREHAA